MLDKEKDLTKETTVSISRVTLYLRLVSWKMKFYVGDQSRSSVIRHSGLVSNIFFFLRHYVWSIHSPSPNYPYFPAPPFSIIFGSRAHEKS